MVICHATRLPRCRPDASVKSSTEARNMRMRAPSVICSGTHLPSQKINFGWYRRMALTMLNTQTARTDQASSVMLNIGRRRGSFLRSAGDAAGASVNPPASSRCAGAVTDFSATIIGGETG
jgi:hypothetical protein